MTAAGASPFVAKYFIRAPKQMMPSDGEDQDRRRLAEPACQERRDGRVDQRAHYRSSGRNAFDQRPASQKPVRLIGIGGGADLGGAILDEEVYQRHENGEHKGGVDHHRVAPAVTGDQPGRDWRKDHPAQTCRRAHYAHRDAALAGEPARSQVCARPYAGEGQPKRTSSKSAR